MHPLISQPPMTPDRVLFAVMAAGVLAGAALTAVAVRHLAHLPLHNHNTRKV